jgi:hypothetical protein
MPANKCAVDDVKNRAQDAVFAGKNCSKKNVNKDSTVMGQYDTIESEGKLSLLPEKMHW